MTYYGEYTTVTDVRSTYLGNGMTAQDTLYLDLIRSTSRDMDAISGRRFAPKVESLVYDTPSDGRCLNFGSRDVLAVSAVTNGDATSIASTEYFLLPNNDYPKSRLELKGSSTSQFTTTTAGDRTQAIAVTAITGYHPDYTEAWSQVDTLGAAITDTTTTTVTITTSAALRKGDLVKIDSEYLYASTAFTTSGTLIRGVNGSTAATHLNGAAIYRWRNPSIETICITAVVAQEKLKNNPVGETVSMGGYTFSTPKDIKKYLRDQLGRLGVVKIYG